jgi:hypothetical protein
MPTTCGGVKMKVYFTGVGSARGNINYIVEMDAIPTVNTEIDFSVSDDQPQDQTFFVRTVVLYPLRKDWQVYCVVGDSRRL